MSSSVVKFLSRNRLTSNRRAQKGERFGKLLPSGWMPLTRAVRHRYSLLTTKQAQNLRDQEKASGIHVEISELDTLLEEILEREKDGKAKIESQDLDKNKKAGKEKATAEEARKQAMERMADNKKRENDESDSGNGRKKVRRSTSDTIDFLTEKSAKIMIWKKRKLNWGKGNWNLLQINTLKLPSNKTVWCVLSWVKCRSNNKACKQCLLHSSNSRTKSSWL